MTCKMARRSQRTNRCKCMVFPGDVLHNLDGNQSCNVYGVRPKLSRIAADSRTKQASRRPTCCAIDTLLGASAGIPKVGWAKRTGLFFSPRSTRRMVFLDLDSVEWALDGTGERPALFYLGGSRWIQVGECVTRNDETHVIPLKS